MLPTAQSQLLFALCFSNSTSLLRPIVLQQQERLCVEIWCTESGPIVPQWVWELAAHQALPFCAASMSPASMSPVPCLVLYSMLHRSALLIALLLNNSLCLAALLPGAGGRRFCAKAGFACVMAAGSSLCQAHVDGCVQVDQQMCYHYRMAQCLFLTMELGLCTESPTVLSWPAPQCLIQRPTAQTLLGVYCQSWQLPLLLTSPQKLRQLQADGLLSFSEQLQAERAYCVFATGLFFYFDLDAQTINESNKRKPLLMWMSTRAVI